MQVVEGGGRGWTTVSSCQVRRGVAPSGHAGVRPQQRRISSARALLRARVLLASWIAAWMSFSAQGAFAQSAAAGPQPASTEATPAPSSNYDFAPGVMCPFCAITPQYPEGQSGLHWHGHWSTVGVREYVTVPVLAGASLGLQFFVPPDQESHWTRPILFDGAVRDALLLGSTGARGTAKTISDVLLIGSFVQPYLVDTFFVSWWGRKAPLVAWQMFVINSQAYALTFVLNAATKRLTSRARPWVEGCDADPTGEGCGSGGRYTSFYSGHAATTATGAGLLCSHHTQLSLYRHPALDTGTCLAAILGTTVTGAMRIASDSHWASDVVVGHFMGYLSGYLLPTLLYYREFRATPHEDEHPAPEAPVFALLPMFSGKSAQAMLVGLF
jgi:membrane-associated phospholipid phosphatase